jgi:hypothetical protein
MATTKVQLIGRQLVNFTMAQKTVDLQPAWTLLIPGGTLGSKNSIELLLQISTRHLAATVVAANSELEIKDIYVTSGNMRSSWSYVGIEHGNEVIYQSIFDYAGSGTVNYSDGISFFSPTRSFDLFKWNGGDPANNQTKTEVDLVPTPSSFNPGLGGYDFNGNAIVGVSDQPAYGWYYLFGFTVIMLPKENRSIEINNGRFPPGIGHTLTPFSIYGNSVFGFCQTDGFTDLRNITEWSLTPGGSGPAFSLPNAVPLLSHTTSTSWYPYSYCYAMHATANWLYVLCNGLDGFQHVVKLTKDGAYSVAADYNLGNIGFTQAFYVVSEDLIYIESAQGNFGMGIYAWVGGDGGHLTTIDADIPGGGWIIWATSAFPSFVTMGYQVVDGKPYIYLGTDGMNGNGTQIFKIGIPGPPEPVCP